MTCESCGDKPKKCNKDFTRTVVEIDNPEQITLMRKVTIPASMGDDTTVPPVVGKYKNVLLFYEANQKSYLYSSDGIPTLLANGLTDYEQAVNLPQINGVTLVGDKTATQLGLQDKLTAGANISIDSDNVISAVDTTYGPATDTEIGLVKPGAGLEVASDGTLSVDDVTFVFDTVADMKASTDLKAGDYARTAGYYSANDGGGATYKIRVAVVGDSIDEKFIIAIGNSNLVAELITDDLVNICQVGGQQNTASICNYIISTKGKSVYIPDKQFTVTETIYINNNYTKFICDGDLSVSTSNIPAICLRANRCVIKLNGELVSENGTGLEICGGDYNAFDNDIFFNSITAKIGVLINPDNGKGFQTSKISFNRIIASEIGFSFAPKNNGNPWVTTLTVYAGHITSPKPVLMVKGTSQTDRFNQIVFYDTTFSGTIETAIDLQHCQNIWFYRCRMVEGLSGSTTWVKLDDCGFVYIDNEGFLPVNKISITNPMADTFPNFFSANMLTNSSQQAIATRAKTYKTLICMLPDPLIRDSVNITSYNTDSFSTPEYYYNGMIVEIGSDAENTALDYVLPEVFTQWGITEFYIYIKEKAATSSLKLRDYPHNTLINIAAGSALSNKRYHAKFVKYINGNPQWIVTSLN